MFDKRLVTSRFARARRTYEAHAQAQIQAANQLVSLLQKQMATPFPSSILELGAGTGILTRELLRSFPEAHLTGTDLSEDMMRHFPHSLPLLVMDGEKPAFAPGSFDVVAGNFVAQWFSDLEEAIAALRCLLRPGGILALTLPMEGTFSQWRQLTGEDTFLFIKQQHIQHWEKNNWLRAWELGKHETVLPDTLSFLRHLRGLGAQTSQSLRQPATMKKKREMLRDTQPILLDYHWIAFLMERG